MLDEMFLSFIQNWQPFFQCIQLFRETLSENSTKLHKPIPKDSMGRRIELLHVLNTRELKQTTTTTATETSPNKRFNEQNNSCARALQVFVHFFVLLCKTRTWNDQILRRLRDVDDDG